MSLWEEDDAACMTEGNKESECLLDKDLEAGDDTYHMSDCLNLDGLDVVPCSASVNMPELPPSALDPFAIQAAIYPPARGNDVSASSLLKTEFPPTLELAFDPVNAAYPNAADQVASYVLFGSSAHETRACAGVTSPPSSPSSPFMLDMLDDVQHETLTLPPSSPSVQPETMDQDTPDTQDDGPVEAQATPLEISPCNKPIITALQNVFEDDETRFELSAAPDGDHPLFSKIPCGHTAVINKRLYKAILDATDKGRVAKGKESLKHMAFKDVQRRMNQIGLTLKTVNALKTLNVPGEDKYSIAFNRKAWEKKRWALGFRPGGKSKK